jgi:hypothetical protein
MVLTRIMTWRHGQLQIGARAPGLCAPSYTTANCVAKFASAPTPSPDRRTLKQ